MIVRLESTEIERAVQLYLNEKYVCGKNAKVKITTVVGKNYTDPSSYVIEADLTLPEDVAAGRANAVS